MNLSFLLRVPLLNLWEIDNEFTPDTQDQPVLDLFDNFPPSSLLSQHLMRLESHVTAVTIYPDRASIKRERRIKLNKGQYQLIIPDLTPDLLDGSVRVYGRGNNRVRIEDVKVETIHTAEIQK